LQPFFAPQQKLIQCKIKIAAEPVFWMLTKLSKHVSAKETFLPVKSSANTVKLQNIDSIFQNSASVQSQIA
jgi:hypothetical protein